jgi:capsid protein
MYSVKDTIAAARWISSRKKVDNAVSTFVKYGVGYSRADGIIGSLDGLDKKSVKKINAAAQVMSDNRAGYYTIPQKFTPDQVVKTSRYTPLNTADYAIAQEHAFKQANRSPQLRASIKFIQRTIYDAKIQAYPNRRILGIDAKTAQEWAANTESIWNLEKDLKDWDETRVNSYPQLADLSFWHYKGLGEFFTILRYYANNDSRIPGVSGQAIHPYQVQSPDFSGYTNFMIYDSAATALVSSKTYLSNLTDGNFIECGIEYTESGEEVAIFIAPSEFGDDWTRVPFKTATGAIQVLHGFIQSEPGQKRGIPDAAYNWHEYMNLADLEMFESETARINSTIAGTVTADSNAGPDGKKPMSEIGASWDELENGETVNPLGALPKNYDVRKVDGGGYIVQGFTPGYKYTSLDTSRPNLNIPEFIEKRLEYMYTADSGLSVVVVKQRFDNSYNASKGAIDLSWKNSIEYYLKQFESDYHRPWYNAWLNAKIANGIISAPGWNNRYKRIAWSDMAVIVPKKPSLNPLNEAKAGKVNCEELFSNRELEAQQITGTSAEENAERLTVQNENLAAARRPLNQDKIDLVLAKSGAETEDMETEGDENGNIPPEKGDLENE